MLESTILFLCLGGYECNVAPRAYYLTNPNLQSWAKESSQSLKQYSKKIPYSEIVAPTVVGFVLLSSGNRITLKISRHISVRLNKDRTEVRWTYAF